MSAGYEWTHVLKLPMVDKLHEVCHAFLRTSEQGEWLPDDRKVNDAFVLHYRRGNWTRGYFTKELSPKPVTRDDLDSPAMELQLKIRPTPTEATVFVQHRLPYDWARTAKWRDRYGETVAAEVAALSAYLHKFYSLQEAPQFQPVL